MLDGGLTRDPEIFEDRGVVHFSIGVDNAGYEKGKDNPSGYFDCKVWLKESKYSAAYTGEAVKAALDDKSFAKGTKVSIVGRLMQERWKNNEGKMSSKPVIVVETIDIFRPRGATSGAASSSASAAPPADPDVDFSSF